MHLLLHVKKNLNIVDGPEKLVKTLKINKLKNFDLTGKIEIEGKNSSKR